MAIRDRTRGPVDASSITGDDERVAAMRQRQKERKSLTIMCPFNMRLRVTHSARSLGRWTLALCLAAALQGWQAVAIAQSSPAPPATAGCTFAAAANAPAAQPCLATLITNDIAAGTYGFNRLELAAAQANDAAYANLLKTCGASGTGCSGAQLDLFNQLRNLEDNADELLGFGETQYSRHLSAQSLGFALRWTADEEYATQGSLTNRIATGQFEAVGNRLSALRFITQTLRLARRDASGDDSDIDDGDSVSGSALGGAASADSGSPEIGKWSVFANASYGNGSKAPTTFDNAFSFAGTQISAGADVRLPHRMVLGFMGTGVQQHANFNSLQSITSGTVKSSGGGLTAYFEKDWDAAYAHFSLGVLRLSLDTRRLVAYPSNNPQVEAVNTNFFSSTDATSWLATTGAGYTFYARGFGATPYLTGQYLGTRIGAFGESGSGTDPEFALRVGGQSVTSLEGIAGLKLQYAFLPRFGVLLAYAYGEFRREFRNQSQAIDSAYANSPSLVEHFQLPTDNVDPNYYEVGGGFITVLPHRTQLYVQYLKVLQLQYYTYYGVAAGFRYEF